MASPKMQSDLFANRLSRSQKSVNICDQDAATGTRLQTKQLTPDYHVHCQVFDICIVARYLPVVTADCRRLLARYGETLYH